MAPIGFVKATPTSEQDKEPSRKAHVLLLLLGVFMTKTEISKTDDQRVEPGSHPEASLPPLCRIQHVLTVVPIGRSTVWLWARQGRFPAPFRVGGITVWNRDEVLAWLKQASKAA